MKIVRFIIIAIVFGQSGPTMHVTAEEASLNRKIDARWLQKNIAGLGPGIPGNIVELQTRIRPLLQEGVGPELIEVGQMEADKWHFVVVRFVNMFEKPIRVADVASSCGCMVAGNTQQLVEPKSEGFVIAVIKPQEHPGVYRKSLTVTFDNGLIWPVMVSGNFVSEFEFDEDTVRTNSLTQEISLVLRRRFGTRELETLNCESLSGYLMVRKSERIDRDSVQVTFAVPVETRRSSVPVSERVVVRDKTSNAQICQLIVGVDVVSEIQCRPRRVLLRRSGDHYSGTVYLVGKLESYEQGFECAVETSIGIPIEVTTHSVGPAGAEIRLLIGSNNVPLQRREVNQVKLIVSDQVLCDDLEFRFFEE